MGATFPVFVRRRRCYTVFTWLRRGQVIYIRLCRDVLLGDEARRWFMIMEAKQAKVNDLGARALKIFNCVRRPARPLRLTPTAASSTLKYSSPVIALGPSGRPVFTTTTRLRAIAAAGRPHSCCASKIRKAGVGRGIRCVSRSAGPGSSSCLMSTCRSARPTRSG
jgi:hypothetical protein